MLRNITNTLTKIANAFEMEIRPTLFTLLEFHASWSFIPRMWESSAGGV